MAATAKTPSVSAGWRFWPRPSVRTPEPRKAVGNSANRFSPARHITAKLPPTLILHGDEDKLVPLQQSQLFVQRAAAAGVMVKLVVKAGAGHGGKVWPNVEEDRTTMADWFDLYLRGKDTPKP